MIRKEILQNTKRYSLFSENTVVTVALSGGADSVALLHALLSLKDELNIVVKAAHLNHLIRGDEAFSDESFVKKLCEDLKVELFCERADVPEFARVNNLSLETAARQVRYKFLNRINEGVIATAHTASDNLETVILNLTRGTALDGLCGIPIKREFIVRPLISCTRDMIEAYCEENKLSFVTDSTNLQDDYTRNKIRHNIVPILKEINPKVENACIRTSFNLREIADDLKKNASHYINENLKENKLFVGDFKSFSPALAKKIIIDYINFFDSEISLEACHIEEIYNICINGGKTGIPKGKQCLCRKGYLYFEEETENIEFRVNIRLENCDFTKISEKINSLLLNNSLDCDKIVGKLVLRTRKSGDKIRIFNRGCTKSLTKLYNEFGIPLNQRLNLPVIADDEGVVWVCGIGVSQRCAITEKTKKMYFIEVEDF